MVPDIYSTCPYASYREGSLAFVRLIDFLQRFTVANQLLIEDHQNKLKANKKTRRTHPPPEFAKITEIMTEMQNLFDRVKLKPVYAETAFQMTHYFSELTEFDRLTFDSRNSSQ